MEQRQPVIIVEALIGAGKTTLVRELGELLGNKTLVLVEPAAKEEGKFYNPYLQNYYSDPARYSLTMQIHLLAMRFRMHKHAQWHALAGAGPALLDRSFYGDVSFAHLQKEMGYMTAHEFQTYQTIYQAMTASVLLPSICIRLLVDPENCNQRIAERMQRLEGRRCEQAISLEYLEKLDVEIGRMTQVLQGQGVEIVEVDYNEARSASERLPVLQELAERINSFQVLDIFNLHRRIL